MTELLHPDTAGIARAADLLRGGGLVAFATETVYGLGADAGNARAVAAIFAAKERPHFNPLISHYPDAEAAFAHVEANTVARRLAEAFWPGPLTLVLPRRADCPVALLAGAGAGACGCAGAAARGGAPGGGALGQPLRRGQPDDRSACAGRVVRADRCRAG